MRNVIIGFVMLLLVVMGVLPGAIDAQSPTARKSLPAIPTTPPATQPNTQPPATPAAQSFKQIRGADGFWRIAQNNNGVWWFLSPDNKPQFINAVTSVQPNQIGRDKDGPSFISSDYDGGLTQTGDLQAWGAKTITRVQDMGFKALGAWSHPIFHKLDIPMTRDLNVWSWIHGPARRFYHPEFAILAEQAIKAQTVPLAANKSLIGYFIDNEIDWADTSMGPAVHFDGLPPDDPNRLEVMKVLQAVWGNPQAFAQDWKINLKDWNELRDFKALPHQPQKAYSRLYAAWIGHLASDYFRLTTQLIHKYDRNHLILGIRFRGYAVQEVVKASRGYTDVQSINYYPADARLDGEMFRMMHELSGQPIMLSEYSFHALDGRSGNRNTVGFYAQVLDQQARADGYKLMTARLARVPYIIGADWFQWNDEPPSGRANDGEDANFGIVDVDDNAYELLAETIKSISPKLNDLHEGSYTDDGRDIWRESFSNKTPGRVPHLNKPPRINGEISDWPINARLPGVRHSQTVGLERSKLPLPNVYLGWREEGVYLAAEVFDTDIHGAPADGWWWTRDNIEFWISTRPVGADQDGYDKYAHEFFFVPNNFPGADGVAGVIGQWKRDGDALKDNLIPHPKVRQICRIFPDRYVVEAFIPAAALNGFDPQKNPVMAFNIHIRNFQHALDYFWSAPKEVQTQLRPKTWGPIHLEPPSKSVQAIKGFDPRQIKERG